MNLVLALLTACELTEGTALPDAQARLICSLDEAERPESAVDATKLAAIYARPDFVSARTPPTEDLMARLKAWVLSLFETSGAETFSNLTRVVVLAAAALLVVFVAVRLRGRRRLAVASPLANAAPLQLADPQAHLATAHKLLGSDARGSAREALLAMISALERQRLARPDRVKTNRELADELPSRGASAAVVSAVTAQLSWFDRAWYSLEPFEETSARQFLEQASAVVALVQQAGR